LSSGGSTVALVDEPVTCSHVKPSGARCRQTIVDATGRCAYHGGHTTHEHLRRVGRRGGSTPGGMGGANGRSLRRYLQEHIDHNSVLRAVKSGLESDDERDRLAAAKVVLGEISDHDRAPELPVRVEPVYDYQAILNALEEVGVALRPELPSMMRALPVLWAQADEAERADFLDAALRIAGRETQVD
jgi:hypothetical protein